MLRQISLQVRAENRIQDAAREHGAKLSILDCKAFNKTGMSLLLEVRGKEQQVKGVVAAIRRMPGIRELVQGEENGGAVPILLVLDRPALCRTSGDAAIVCLVCPLNAESQPAEWRFIARRSSDLRQILSQLNREGIETRIEDVSSLERKATLTGRQKEIMATAVAQGYFEFPRRVSLTGLSQIVGVKPSTLSEILRSAERRIMESALGLPFQED